MATNIEVTKSTTENTGAVLRKFTQRMRSAGIVQKCAKSVTVLAHFQKMAAKRRQYESLPVATNLSALLKKESSLKAFAASASSGAKTNLCLMARHAPFFNFLLYATIHYHTNCSDTYSANPV